ncbi:hypothetical protein ABBQ38_005117 [Trebouxia sp. C0009 RCD-2024]
MHVTLANIGANSDRLGLSVCNMTSVMQCLPTGIIASVPPVLLRLDDSISPCVGPAPLRKRPKLHLTQAAPKTYGLEDLPDEIFGCILGQCFTFQDYCSLSQVSLRYSQVASSDVYWEPAYCQRYGAITDVTRDAATLANSWKELFRCRTVTNKQGEPRLSPCFYELTAVLQRIAYEQAAATQPGGVMFLLDGSGSVSTEDFDVMTRFVYKAVPVLHEIAPTTKVGIIQFSTDVHIQQPLAHVDRTNLLSVMTDMERMHGGTDMALAIQTASTHMQTALPPGGLQTLLILSDGFIDKYQGDAAVVAAHAMQTEQAEVSFYAFGVGCAVNRTELDRVVAANGCTDADCRYMALAVLPESLG